MVNRAIQHAPQIDQPAWGHFLFFSWSSSNPSGQSCPDTSTTIPVHLSFVICNLPALSAAIHVSPPIYRSFSCFNCLTLASDHSYPASQFLIAPNAACRRRREVRVSESLFTFVNKRNTCLQPIILIRDSCTCTHMSITCSKERKAWLTEWQGWRSAWGHPGQSPCCPVIELVSMYKNDANQWNIQSLFFSRWKLRQDGYSSTTISMHFTFNLITRANSEWCAERSNVAAPLILPACVFYQTHHTGPEQYEHYYYNIFSDIDQCQY